MKRPLLALVAMVLFGALSSVAWAVDYVYMTEDLDARRFSDTATPVSGKVEAGDKLEVVYRLDDWIRVRLPGRAGFGWVPEAKTSVEPPEGVDEGAPPSPGTNALTPEQRKRLEDALKQIDRQGG